MKDLSTVLTNEFGKGFSVTNIQQMRNFYLVYQKQQTLSVKFGDEFQQTASVNFKLSWSCQNKSEAVVEYTLPQNNEHIFASRYKTVLPSKEELKILMQTR